MSHVYKISVLLPAFNSEKYIEETIQSILSQSYPDFELLISDDCSTDNTRQLIESFSDDRIKCHHNSGNLKKPLTVQKLFKKSKGDIITVHDSDDTSLPKRFEKIIDFLDNHSDIYMCGHTIERMSENGTPLGLYRNKTENYETIKELMSKDNSDGDPSMFIRREVIEELGEVFRPYFTNNMDYDLGLRIIEKFKTSNLPEVLSYYRNVPNSISKGVPSYHKLTTQKVTQYLARERKEGKIDALQRNDHELIRELEKKYSIPYVKDQTLHFREMASFFMYCRMNSTAVQYMFLAVKKEPYKFKNWHTLLYCIRKTLFRF